MGLFMWVQKIANIYALYMWQISTDVHHLITTVKEIFMIYDFDEPPN
jgi:hypothetical protein